MEEEEPDYKKMTEGQLADYEAGLWGYFTCPQCGFTDLFQGHFATDHEEEKRFMTVNGQGRCALWKKIEAMTPDERLEFLGCEFMRLTKYSKTGPPVTEYSKIGPPGNGWLSVIPHTQLWRKVRRSFNHSPEWKSFRAAYLKHHAICKRCGKPATVVHHRPPQNLDATVLNEGFLAPLQDESRFEALCQDCHYQEHEVLVASERPEEYAQYQKRLGRSNEKQTTKIEKRQYAKRTVKRISTRCPGCNSFSLNQILNKSKIKGKVQYMLKCPKCGKVFSY
jgi:uncharacterized protein (DUF983 family)